MNPRLQQAWMDQVRATSPANFTAPQYYTHRSEGMPDQQVETFFRNHGEPYGGTQDSPVPQPAPAPEQPPDAGLGLGGRDNLLSTLLNRRRTGSRSPRNMNPFDSNYDYMRSERDWDIGTYLGDYN